MRQLFLLLTLLALLATTSLSAELTGRVLWVYDGDTLKIENIGKVRLLGIDTPESQPSSKDHFYIKSFSITEKRLRKIAKQAKYYNIHNLKDRRVSLELDQTHRDKYDRLLAYVYLPDGRMLNRILLQKGLATVFRRYDFQYKKDFLEAEAKARNGKLGLWE